MPKFRDLVGRTFGRLAVLRRYGTSAHKKPLWLCRCSCGKTALVVSHSLLNEWTKSCGCLRREVTGARNTIHGRSGTAEYSIWKDIIRRCSQTSRDDYHLYGGRGIGVSFKNFAAFYTEVGPRPSPQHSIDRIDNNRGYEPGNVRWATPKE